MLPRALTVDPQITLIVSVDVFPLNSSIDRFAQSLVLYFGSSRTVCRVFLVPPRNHNSDQVLPREATKQMHTRRLVLDASVALHVVAYQQMKLS